MNNKRFTKIYIGNYSNIAYNNCYLSYCKKRAVAKNIILQQPRSDKHHMILSDIQNIINYMTIHKTPKNGRTFEISGNPCQKLTPTPASRLTPSKW